MSVYIIGCGGVGSWLAPALAKLIEQENLWLVDGDKLEAKNIDRQLFDDKDVGKYKAEALGLKYGLRYLNSFYGLGTCDHTSTDWLLCACDNHPARASVLIACDVFRCRAIIGANETHSAEAYYYQPDWVDTPLDPRVFYPELLTDTSDDPMKIEGCTGVAQQNNPQLSSSNFMAAALMQHLLVLWKLNATVLGEDVLSELPHLLSATLSRIGCARISETINKEKGQAA